MSERAPASFAGVAGGPRRVNDASWWHLCATHARHAAGEPRLVRNGVLSRGAVCRSWASERKTACLSVCLSVSGGHSHC